MKMKKMLSVILAVCLVLSMAAMTGLAAEPRAAYAGRTMRGLVVFVDKDGTVTEQEVEVDIPARATQQEQDVLVNTATMNTVASVTGQAVPRTSAKWDIISENIGSTLVEGSYNKEVGSGKLTKDYEAIVVQLSNIWPTNPPIYELIVSLMSSESPGQYAEQKFSFETSRDFNVLFQKNSTSVSMREDSVITAYARTDQNGIDIRTCRIWGVPA